MKNPKNPEISFELKNYFTVGCKLCTKGEFNWKILSNGKEFVAICSCGHVIKVSSENLREKPIKDYTVEDVAGALLTEKQSRERRKTKRRRIKR